MVGFLSIHPVIDILPSMHLHSNNYLMYKNEFEAATPNKIKILNRQSKYLSSFKSHIAYIYAECKH